MDDLAYGARDKRGFWRPNAPLSPAPLLATPFSPSAVLKWLPGFFLPWNALFMLSSVVFWLWLTPDIETLKTLRPGWIFWLYARNAVAVFLYYGAFELRLYVFRRQAGRFKYNPAFPADVQNDAFFFKSQTLDSLLRVFGSGVPIWTAYEVGILWAFANGYAPMSHNPVWIAAIVLFTPFVHELHFYVVHRAIHIPWLYRWVHSVHHNSVNPSPWSSLSMHPVEHLFYFSGALIHLLIRSHPIAAIYHLHFAGFGAVVGHVGFDKIETGKQGAVDTHAYAHYLHHRHFEVNYADGLLPLDAWFGTWHDGTKAGDEAMARRWREKVARANAASPPAA